jgi:hypothetical protein
MERHFAERLTRLAQGIEDEAFDLTQIVRGDKPISGPVKAEAKIVRPKLNLADYFAADAEPPPALNRSAFMASAGARDPLGNTDWGCCGDAMTIHGIEAFHTFNQTPVPPFVVGDSLGLYSAVSGFNINAGPPGNNPTDTGTDNQQLVDYWRNQGVLCAADGSRHSIAGSLFVDPKDQRVTRLAIYEFLVLFRAVGLPIAAQGQNRWVQTDPNLQGNAAVGSWGYHDIPYFSYDSTWYHADSWGEDILIGRRWDQDYGVQGFVVVTQEMTNLQGVSPSGLDWTRLNQDLANFPAQTANQ